MVRLTAPLVLVGAVALAMAGCSGDVDEAAPTSTQTTPGARVDAAEQLFLQNISHDAFLDDLDDADLVAVGREACTVVASGGDIAAAKAVVAAVVSDPDSTDLVTRTAITEFCGEFDHLVDVDLGGAESPEPVPTGDARALFISAVRALPSVDETVTDDMIVMLGRTYCDGFARGDDEATALGYMSMFPTEDAKVILRATVTHLCPEHASRVS